MNKKVCARPKTSPNVGGVPRSQWSESRHFDPDHSVRKLLAELAAAGEVVMSQLTRYDGSKAIEAWQRLVSGYVPAPAPGRKPKAA
jgi:hypothetical protein